MSAGWDEIFTEEDVVDLLDEVDLKMIDDQEERWLYDRVVDHYSEHVQTFGEESEVELTMARRYGWLFYKAREYNKDKY